ncbi:MAG TPA: Type 1 glutamine amidotransferase-like domain-containing protein [Actinomycetota bacterium]|nr:Type 1 glutamine amidotransferase-like domain-containing protein [Actinomycetota bacterium]
MTLLEPSAGPLDAPADAGPAVLLGGWEHTPGCESIDEMVMEHLGTRSPRVSIVPVASTPRMLPVAIERAHGYWKRLGGTVAVALPRDTDPSPAIEALDGADIVVLTGGLADRIIPVLLQTGIWDRIVERWRRGSALVGSSRGLIDLFEWRWALRLPRPLRLTRGLGLFGGYVAVPHFDKYALKRWGPRLGPELHDRDLGLLGLDERTALVGDGTGFTVVGSGMVTVVDDRTVVRYTPGDRLDRARFATRHH